MATMDLSNEIVRLRAELEAVTAQRDLLLCEVNSLRRELLDYSTADYKHLHDDSYNQKIDDEGGAHTSLNSSDGFFNPMHHHSHQRFHLGVSINSNAPSHLQMLQSQQSGQGSVVVGMEQSQHPLEAGDLEHTSYIEGNRYVNDHGSSRIQGGHAHLTSGLNHSNSSCSSGSNASSGIVVTANGTSTVIPTDGQLYMAPPEGFGIPNGLVIHNKYEMSQDLLDKQIEILERKYGGLRARNAAYTIQRAFRRYTLLKKFSAITAMAKAEKRLTHSQDSDIYANTISQKCQNNIDNKLARPLRSMSLRDRHDLGINIVNKSQSPNQSDIDIMAARVQQSAHQLNMMGITAGITNGSSKDQSQISNRSDVDSGVCNCSVSGSVTNISTTSLHNDSMNNHHHMHFSNSVSVNSSPNPSLLAWSQNCSVDGYYYNSSPNDTFTAYCVDRGPIYGNMLSTGGKPLSSPTLRQQQQLAALHARRVPPEVPKRTSSITISGHPVTQTLVNSQHGSMSSVQSSGSDSSTTEHQRSMSGSSQQFDISSERYAVWKRQPSNNVSREYYVSPDQNVPRPPPRSSPPACYPTTVISESNINHQAINDVMTANALKASETVRKRQYRVGLNLFNKKPERGIAYLIRRGFLENSPRGVARFLITRKGLSKQMIGEYLGNLQGPFNMAVLECFVSELDLSGMQVDVALRKFQAYFRMPGEAQKIERLVEVFSRRYCMCNPDLVQRLRTNDTIFVLAFAIIMLNTDLHTPNLKPESRMSLEDFIKNLRGIDDCGDIDREMLVGIYERIKASEFKPASDHVTQVLKVQATIVGKKPQLALPHRRLVCYCRLYEIPDINKKERPGVHQREVFLFNDLLVVTKIFSKKKSSVTYTYRQSFPLVGMSVNLFSVPHYPYGIQLSRRVDSRPLVAFNARNEHDRAKFAEDLRESAAEMDDMEAIRIETELAGRAAKTRGQPSHRTVVENRDSGVADVELEHQQHDQIHQQMHGQIMGAANGAQYHQYHQSHIHAGNGVVIKRNVLSNSLVDINDPVALAQERLQRRGSVGSLDSGMSVSFHHSSSTRALHTVPPPQQAAPPPPVSQSSALYHKTVPFANHSPHAVFRNSNHNHYHHHGQVQHHHPGKSISTVHIEGNGSRSRRERGGSMGGQDKPGKTTEV